MTPKERQASYHKEIVEAGLCYTCRKAPASKELNRFGTPHGQCAPCRVIRAGRYRTQGRPRYLAMKEAVFNAYGGAVCVCCGETERMFLAIDHVNGGGRKHKKSIGKGIEGIYKWLKDNGYPAGFQILCHNCNQGRESNKGICPHQATVNLAMQGWFEATT